MNILLLKQISILSLIAGAALGVVTIIPFIGGIAFLFLMMCIGAALIIYLKKMTLVGFLELKDGALYGGIAGFVSFLGFAAVYFPLASIIGLIFKNSQYSLVTFSVGSGFFVVLLLSVFVAILSAVINSFSALAATYIYAQLEPRPEENTTNFEIEE